MTINESTLTTHSSTARKGESTQKVLAGRLAALHDDFMRLSWPRFVVAFVFVVACSYFSIGPTRSYYSSFKMPPSFRHMETPVFYPVLVDYLDGQKAGPDTLLVLGDCVAFGHGVLNSFSAYLNVPNLHVVNVSMQSFRYDLMTATVIEAARRGVKHVLVQLHPFEDYGLESQVWYELAKRHPASPAIRAALESDKTGELDIDFAAQALVNWRMYAAAWKAGRATFHTVPAYDLRIQFSSVLRNDILSSFPLYRNRFAIDDWLGTKLSFYSARTKRSDAFVERLPEQRQIDILKQQSWLWPKFVVNDREEYRERALKYSAPIRLAQTMKSLNMEATFIMAPTLVTMLSKHTVIRRSDLEFVSNVMKEAVTKYGFRYIDFLEDPELEPHMIHYDNLTADGQKVFGRILNEKLASQEGTAVLKSAGISQ